MDRAQNRPFGLFGFVRFVRVDFSRLDLKCCCLFSSCDTETVCVLLLMCIHRKLLVASPMAVRTCGVLSFQAVLCCIPSHVNKITTQCKCMISKLSILCICIFSLALFHQPKFKMWLNFIITLRWYFKVCTIRSHYVQGIPRGHINLEKAKIESEFRWSYYNKILANKSWSRDFWWVF